MTRRRRYPRRVAGIGDSCAPETSAMMSSHISVPYAKRCFILVHPLEWRVERPPWPRGLHSSAGPNASGVEQATVRFPLDHLVNSRFETTPHKTWSRLSLYGFGHAPLSGLPRLQPVFHDQRLLLAVQTHASHGAVILPHGDFSIGRRGFQSRQRLHPDVGYGSPTYEAVATWTY